MSLSRFSYDRIIFLTLAMLVSTFTGPVYAQVSDVDPTFNAVPSNPLTAGSSHMVQPDGKVIVFGTRSVVDNIPKSDMFRLNTDGTLDATFNYCGCEVDAIRSAKLEPDGRILLTGRLGQTSKMLRLNVDGTLNATLVSVPPPPFGSTEYFVETVRPDGKFYVTRRDSGFGANVTYGLYRYNTDGSVDSSFTPVTIASGNSLSVSVRIALLADGRFFLAATSTSGATGSVISLRRYNVDGSVDGTWEAPSFPVGASGTVFISDIVAIADGSVVATGRFTSVNGADKQNLVKLLAPGNVDLSFGGANVLFGSRLYGLSDGKFLFAGNIDVGGEVKIFRLNSNGTVDNTFTMDPSVTGALSQFDVDSTLRIIFFGQTATGVKLVRLLANGARDLTFSPNIALYGSVYAAAVQTDGKVVLAGIFTKMNGTDRNSFARVNADGSLDPTFNPGTGFNQPPDTMVIQPDGKIVAIGPFTNYDGATVTGIVRINTNGTRDSGFSATTSSRPYGIALEADGQILISGAFNTVDGVGRTGVARLNSDGTLDNAFNPVIGSPDISAVVVQPDGKITIGGVFSGVNGFNRANLARLLENGSLDETFTATGVSGLNILKLQADGKYVYATTTKLFRRNNDGSNDAGFISPTFTVSGAGSGTIIHAIDIRPDGSILVGGRFEMADQNVRRNIARLAPNGAFDVLFLPGGADNRVRALASYSTNKVIAGGDFAVINGVSKSGVARLNVVTFHGKTPFDFDGDGRADYTAYRPSTGVWYELSSASNTYVSPTFGLSGDIPVPADFDGDGKTDEAIFRPSNGDWWYQSSINNAQLARHYGQSGDVPRPGDFDADGKADFIVYRPSDNRWYRVGSSIGEVAPYAFGLPGDVPLVGDFDGDGKVDPAIFRPSNGDWWYAATSSGLQHRSIHWGANGDVPAPADFDGDGKTDVAVFRPSNGAWYIFKSSDLTWIITGFGLSGDRPVPADYDGDGRADIAVFRPSDGIWYLNQSTAGIGGVQWGLATDVVAPNAFLP